MYFNACSSSAPGSLLSLVEYHRGNGPTTWLYPPAASTVDIRTMSRSEIRMSSSTVITASVRMRYVGMKRFDSVSGTRGSTKCAVVPRSWLQTAIVGGRKSCDPDMHRVPMQT